MTTFGLVYDVHTKVLGRFVEEHLRRLCVAVVYSPLEGSTDYTKCDPLEQRRQPFIRVKVILEVHGYILLSVAFSSKRRHRFGQAKIPQDPGREPAGSGADQARQRLDLIFYLGEERCRRVAIPDRHPGPIHEHLKGRKTAPDLVVDLSRKSPPLLFAAFQESLTKFSLLRNVALNRKPVGDNPVVVRDR